MDEMNEKLLSAIAKGISIDELSSALAKGISIDDVLHSLEMMNIVNKSFAEFKEINPIDFLSSFCMLFEMYCMEKHIDICSASDSVNAAIHRMNEELL